MCSNTVRLDTFVDLTVQIGNLGSTTGAGSAGFRIDDNCIHVDQSLFGKGIDRQNGAGWETARIGDQTRLFDILTVDLTQSVNSFFDKVRTLMVDSVPLLVFVNILDTEIRT